MPTVATFFFLEFSQVRVLYFVGRALLKEDRPTFALHLVHGMNPHLFQPVSAALLRIESQLRLIRPLCARVGPQQVVPVASTVPEYDQTGQLLLNEREKGDDFLSCGISVYIKMLILPGNRVKYYEVEKCRLQSLSTLQLTGSGLFSMQTRNHEVVAFSKRMTRSPERPSAFVFPVRR